MTRSRSKKTNSTSRLPKNRLEAFSDGVLAIVITILVLELKVPEIAEGKTLIAALADDWRHFVGYLISFMIVGGSWLSHSNATRLIDRGDDILFRLTLVWLLFVSLIPFATSLMTEFLSTPSEPAAVAIYGVNVFLASAFLTVAMKYAASRPEWAASDIADEELLATVRERNAITAVQGVSVGIAIFAPNVAVILYLLSAVLFIVVPLVLVKRNRRLSRAAP